MGDPRRIRKNYANPRMQWNEASLTLEKGIKKDYRPKNKKEIWKMNAFLQNIKDQAKSINSMLGTARREQALIEQEQLINRVKRYGLVKKEDVSLGDLLGLELSDVMERRLQTLVVRKKLARSMKQSRQFVTHGHIMVGGKKVTSPSYIVPKDDDETIDFVARSPMNSTSHPERGDVDPSIVLKDSRSESAPESSETVEPAEESKDDSDASEEAKEDSTTSAEEAPSEDETSEESDDKDNKAEDTQDTQEEKKKDDE